MFRRTSASLGSAVPSAAVPAAAATAVPAAIAAAAAALLLALAGCEERVVTCEQAVSHVAGIMKHSKSEQKRRFWTDKRAVDGQLHFCKRERPNPELMRCAVEANDEDDYEECLDKHLPGR
ncbi:MAG TPA: hypothetical protein VM261_16060 [Kofleriaceae bacterium]|nr:hypothetical protein [Kofleriaceae bacterium]